MFAKNQRINSVLFKTLFNKGKKIHGNGFFVVYQKDPDIQPARFSVVVPKKVEKTAVGRHKLKRKASHALKQSETLPDSGAYIVIYKQNNADLGELEMLFKKITKE